MSSHRLATMLGALIFLSIAAAALYRLLFGFAINVGGTEIGQTSTFFVLVASAALSLILFRGALARG